MGLSEIDRNLLERCLQKKPRAWEDFVDRFMGLVLHVIRHTAQSRSVRLSPEDRDDLCAEVFLGIIKKDLAVLRNFSARSSLATYLTVIARRIVVHEMLARRAMSRLTDGGAAHAAESVPDRHNGAEERLENQEEIQRLLDGLNGTEARVVRMYHLEGKSYQEIGSAVGMSENSVGPILSRARDKLRRASVNSPAAP
ncbi:MAG: sigma-70 family RNA polymerase sigma factor [Thermoguttaceae bacterium]